MAILAGLDTTEIVELLQDGATVAWLDNLEGMLANIHGPLIATCLRNGLRTAASEYSPAAETPLRDRTASSLCRKSICGLVRDHKQGHVRAGVCAPEPFAHSSH